MALFSRVKDLPTGQLIYVACGRCCPRRRVSVWELCPVCDGNLRYSLAGDAQQPAQSVHLRLQLQLCCRAHWRSARGARESWGPAARRVHPHTSLTGLIWACAGQALTYNGVRYTSQQLNCQGFGTGQQPWGQGNYQGCTGCANGAPPAQLLCACRPCCVFNDQVLVNLGRALLPVPDAAQARQLATEWTLQAERPWVAAALLP